MICNFSNYETKETNFINLHVFLLFLSISKITGNIPRNIPLTSQRSAAGQRTIWPVRAIQRITATLAILTDVQEGSLGGFRLVAVAALRRLPRPAEVAARLVGRWRSSW
jgi:hypothetical protein